MKLQLFLRKPNKLNKNWLSSLLPINKYKISGNSMYPLLKPGSTVLVYKYFFLKPRIGDIVVCKAPRNKKILIKRVVKIENNKYFVEGDNKIESTDSREFGALTKKNIIGKVISIL